MNAPQLDDGFVLEGDWQDAQMEVQVFTEPKVYAEFSFSKSNTGRDSDGSSDDTNDSMIIPDEVLIDIYDNAPFNHTEVTISNLQTNGVVTEYKP
jgi:hypothetical protein